MPESDARTIEPDQQPPLVLLGGATGYIGKRLLPLLEQRSVRVRCLARTPEKLRRQVAESTEIVKGDVLDRPSLDSALTGVSTAYYLIRSLTNRLPVMICPHWLATPTQPIAIKDVLEYLIAALDLPPGESLVFEIGGSDVVTYGQLIQEYARQRGLRRYLISVPFLTPYLSSLWLGLVTPATAGVGRHLIEGLKNPTIVRNMSAQEVFPIRPMGVKEAMRQALEEADQAGAKQ